VQRYPLSVHSPQSLPGVPIQRGGRHSHRGGTHQLRLPTLQPHGQLPQARPHRGGCLAAGAAVVVEGCLQAMGGKDRGLNLRLINKNIGLAGVESVSMCSSLADLQHCDACGMPTLPTRSRGWCR
jgi:hypothetical protein